MTVAELIVKLQAMEPSLIVAVWADDGFPYDNGLELKSITTVTISYDGNSVVLE